MTLLDEFSSASGGAYSIALLVVLISIMLSGIGIGIGKGLRNRKIEGAGQEELVQSVINAALIGGLFLFTTAVDSSIGSFVHQISKEEFCPSLTTEVSTANGYSQCVFSYLQSQSFFLADSLTKANNVLCFLSKLNLQLGIVSSQPFFSLESLSSTLSLFINSLYFLFILASTHLAFLNFILTTAFLTFLPIGLILRSFFLTRKLGGAIMGIAIAFYAIYPLLFLVAYPELLKGKNISDAASALTTFNGKYSSIPLLDLGKENTLREKINELSNNDFIGEVNALSKSVSLAISDLSFQLIIIPLLSLAVTLIATRELALALGSEINLGKFELL